MEKEQAEHSRQMIFELALNIARLQMHRAWLDDGGILNHLSGSDDPQRHIEQLRLDLEDEAKSILMRGGWEVL